MNEPQFSLIKLVNDPEFQAYLDKRMAEHVQKLADGLEKYSKWLERTEEWQDPESER